MRSETEQEAVAGRKGRKIAIFETPPFTFLEFWPHSDIFCETIMIIIINNENLAILPPPPLRFEA